MVCHHVLEETMILEGVAIFTPLTELMFRQAVFMLQSVLTRDNIFIMKAPWFLRVLEWNATLMFS